MDLRLIFSVGLLWAWGVAGAQEKVAESAARANLVSQIVPTYPARARASHLTGNVLVEVKINARGHVESAEALSGAMLLRPAAVEAVRQWVFKPAIEGGLASSVTTILTIGFPPGGARTSKPGPGSPVSPATSPAVAGLPQTRKTNFENGSAAPGSALAGAGPLAAALPSGKSASGRPTAEAEAKLPVAPASASANPSALRGEPVAGAPAPAPTAHSVVDGGPGTLRPGEVTKGNEGGGAAAADAVAQDYTTLARVCDKLVAERAESSQQAAACVAAAQKARSLGEDGHFLERRSAFVYAATALIRNERFNDAVTYGGYAVAVVKQGHDDHFGSSAAYAVKGQAEALNHDFSAADADLAVAERFERESARGPADGTLSRNDAAALKQLLNLRSQVLVQLGRHAEAQRLKQEAERL